MAQAVMAAYPLSLAALIAWLSKARDNLDLRTAIALFVNWVVGMAFALTMPAIDVWSMLIVIDGLTAYAVLRPPAHVQQAIVGGLLLSQVIWHVAFGLVGNANSLPFYLQALTCADCLQAAALFGGAAYDTRRKVANMSWRDTVGSSPSSDAARDVSKRK